jgi:hypothetical protein
MLEAPVGVSIGASNGPGVQNYSIGPPGKPSKVRSAFPFKNCMKLKSILCLALFAFLSVSLQAAQPLRVFIRGGVKTHGPGQHDHPRFLGEWT